MDRVQYDWIAIEWSSIICTDIEPSSSSSSSSTTSQKKKLPIRFQYFESIERDIFGSASKRLDLTGEKWRLF